MKKKILFGIFLIIIIGMIIFFVMQSLTNEKETKIDEYTPQEEISEVQNRQTLVTLYFQNKETKELAPEARLIDAKLLIENPCETLINLLLEGPKNDKLEAVIPTDTKLNNVSTVGNTAILDFNENFAKEANLGKKEEEKITNSIVKTLTQLTEIEEVQFLVNGKE